MSPDKEIRDTVGQWHESGLSDETLLSALTSVLDLGLIVVTQEELTYADARARELLGGPSGVFVDAAIASMLESKLADRSAQKQGLVRVQSGRLIRLRRARLPGSDSTFWFLQDVTAEQSHLGTRPEFVAGIERELRSSVASIRVMAETLRLDSMIVDSDSNRFLATIVKECERLSRFCEALAELTSSEDAEDPAVVDLVEIVREVVQHQRIPAAEAGVKLTLWATGPLPILANRQQLPRVFSHLIDNAVTHTAADGEVRISIEPKLERIEVKVSDSGGGIARKHLPRVFDTFYRGNRVRSRRMGGFGLGLAIAREIVGRHNGQISIDTQAGAGTTVTVSLPRA